MLWAARAHTRNPLVSSECLVVFLLLEGHPNGNDGEEKILNDLWGLFINLQAFQNLSGVLYCWLFFFFPLLVA